MRLILTPHLNKGNYKLNILQQKNGLCIFVIHQLLTHMQFMSKTVKTTLKKKLLILFAVLLMIGFALQSIFGIVISLLLCGMIGFTTGLYRKDKSVWQPSALVVLACIAAILTFIILLIHSDM